MIYNLNVVMKRLLILLITAFAITGCNRKKEESQEVFIPNDYGAFLGRSDNDVTGFNQYKYVSVELDEFTHTNIERLTRKGTKFLAYLNVGSLENYRDYYEDYESFTFKNYDNWPDERWIDVTNQSWQDKMVELAEDFKNEGAFGVYMDNVDVYSIAKEEEMNYTAFASAIKSIISRIDALGLKVLVNGGAEYFDDMNDLGGNVFNYVWAYHQEEVFSLIEDYDENVFSTQGEEDRIYYQEIANLFKSKNKEVFLLEYTTDNSLKEAIENYCLDNNYHYFISSTVELL